jgi:hypothetical protein
MEASTDLTCGALAETTGEPASLHRFIVGVDPAPVELGQAEIEALGDPFARLLLAKGVFPVTAEELVEQLRAAAPDGDSLKTLQTFLVGEGSQLQPDDDAAGIRAFIATCGAGTDGPDVIISAFGPDDGQLVEVMAWDAVATGFNYYQTRSGSPWVIAGNSADALRPGSAGNGPFMSHPSGSPIMKELRFPWVHWQSFAATIRADVVGSELAGHPWFRDAAGAEQLETGAMMPAITRWTNARLKAAVAADGAVAEPAQIMKSFLGTPTVNLVSSQAQFSLIAGGGAAQLDIPHAFFADTEGLGGILGLPVPDASQVTIDAAAYVQVLADHQVALRDGSKVFGGVPQDTHFAFVVPERAFEDIAAVRAAIDIGLVSRRLAACLLMVDFSNPVFSGRRSALLEHVPANATVSDGQSSFSEDFADAIRATPAAGEDGTPEQEFARLWDAGDDWPQRFAELLTPYYAAVAAKLAAPGGLTEVFRLAESRRKVVRGMPISEHPLLFATPDPPLTGSLRMLPGGEIVEG